MQTGNRRWQTGWAHSLGILDIVWCTSHQTTSASKMSPLVAKLLSAACALLTAPHAPGQGKPRGVCINPGPPLQICCTAAVQESVCRADCCIHRRALRYQKSLSLSPVRHRSAGARQPTTAQQRSLNPEQPCKALPRQHGPNIAAQQSYGRPCQPSRAQQASPTWNSPASLTSQPAHQKPHSKRNECVLPQNRGAEAAGVGCCAGHGGLGRLNGPACRGRSTTESRALHFAQRRRSLS